MMLSQSLNLFPNTELDLGMSEAPPLSFSQRVVRWQRQYGRHDLPWQGKNAYHVWLSEVMLQQTQVTTVIPYYQRFLDAFPDVYTLADAPLEAVLALWSGLGYYARARYLHRAAQQVVQVWKGEFPNQVEQLCQLAGVGRSTAAAIAAFAYGVRAAILDGNVKRVLLRHEALFGHASDSAVSQQLWAIAENYLPDAEYIRPYTQGLMDLGSLVCTRQRPRCMQCPLQSSCKAVQHGLTHQLPTPKKTKQIPLSNMFALLITTPDNSVWLERRDTTGIWGGLWSLPMLTAAEWSTWQTQAKMAFWHWSLAPAFVHTFTHQRWQIAAVHCVLLPEQCASIPWCATTHGQWFRYQDALEAGIPVPTRQILSTMISAEKNVV